MPVETNTMPTSPADLSASSWADPIAVTVWESVDRICMSAEFVRSKRMIALLRFLLDAYFAHDLDRLSERSIGQAIFGRPEDWDPTTDTIVRSEIRRLRSKLRAYYDSVGSSDPVRIIVPKGTYIPQFEYIAPRDTLIQPPLHTQPQRSLWRSRHLILVSVFVVLTVVTTLFGLVLFRTKPQPEMLYKTNPFTSDLGQEFAPAFSHDGRWIAYSARRFGSETRIYIKGIDGKSLRAVTSSGKVSLFPAWSPDGLSLAYLEEQAQQVLVRVHRVSDLSGNQNDRTVTAITRESGRWSDQPSDLLGNPGPIWLPDGRSLIVSDCTPLHCGLVIIADTGKRTWLTSVPGDGRDFDPRLSPDGSTVAFVRYYSHGSSDIYTIPVSGGQPVQVTQDRRAIQGIAWDPDGKSLVASWNRDGAFALWRIRRDGKATKLHIDTTAPAEPSVSLTGAIAYVESNENWNIWRAPLAAGGMGKASLLLSSSGRNYDPRYSPDGKRIAFVSDRSGNMQLWTANLDGSDLKQRTNLVGTWMGGISWSPDGSTIAFDARPQGKSSIYLIDLTTNAVHPLHETRYEERMPSFSRDGRSLYFNSTRGGEVDIWRYEFKTGALEKFHIPNAFAAAELNDSGILILAGRHGEIWTASSSSDPPTRWSGITADPDLSWFPSASGLYFTRARHDGKFELCHAAPSRSVKCLGSFPAPLALNAPDIAVSPDERSILFAEQDSSTGDIKLATPVWPK